MSFDITDREHPQHVEWLIDEASRGSFPASDPSSIAQSHPRSEIPGPGEREP